MQQRLVVADRLLAVKIEGEKMFKSLICSISQLSEKIVPKKKKFIEEKGVEVIVEPKTNFPDPNEMKGTKLADCGQQSVFCPGLA